jgi:tripartite-type tricarboxylate transporter receptor subunit TctC
MKQFFIIVVISIFIIINFNYIYNTNNSISFISPSSMGRGSDITIRNISRSLKINDLINKDIVVKNIIGANGGIALEELLDCQPFLQQFFIEH